MSFTEAKEKAAQDYAAAVGTVIAVPVLYGFVGNDSVERRFELCW